MKTIGTKWKNDFPTIYQIAKLSFAIHAQFGYPRETEHFIFQNEKIAMRTFGTKNEKTDFQQFIRSRNYHLQFMPNLTAQGKQNVSFRHRQLQSIEQMPQIITCENKLLNFRHRDYI